MANLIVDSQGPQSPIGGFPAGLPLHVRVGDID